MTKFQHGGSLGQLSMFLTVSVHALNAHRRLIVLQSRLLVTRFYRRGAKSKKVTTLDNCRLHGCCFKSSKLGGYPPFGSLGTVLLMLL